MIQSASRVMDLVVPGGLLVMSGIDESERGTVRDAFAAMCEVASYSEEGWVGLVLRSA